MTTTVNKKQIAKNALYLYVRTFFVIVLMLVASRVLLRALGAEDFGLYNLVGSIVAMFTSLRVVFASATQRFLNYEKSHNNVQILSNIFVISKRLHWGLSIFFLIITECLGIWALNDYLVIPDGRLPDAYIALQCSIFSAIAMLLTVPYDAVIISNERFNAYAYLAILECALQLGAAYAVIIIPENKLVWYSILVLVAALLVRFINTIYCRFTFEECRHEGKFDKVLFKDMAKFAGWNFLGNFAISIYNEGINMILNIFGGVIANAARAISTQVLKGISSISDRMSAAFAPQATQQYAIGDHNKFQDLIILSTKLINYLYLLMAVPIALFTPLILEIWLGEIPQYSIEFVRASLLYGFARSIHSPLNMSFQCGGKLKIYQIIELCSLLPSLPLAYILLKIGLPLYWALLAMAITNFINNIIITILANKQLQLNIKAFLFNTIIPIVIIGICSMISGWLICTLINNVYLQIILSISMTGLLILFVGLSKNERTRVFSLLKKYTR